LKQECSFFKVDIYREVSVGSRIGFKLFFLSLRLSDRILGRYNRADLHRHFSHVNSFVGIFFHQH
jgi:hypothetical protein